MPGVYDDEKSKHVDEQRLQELEDSFAAPDAAESGSQKLQEQQDLEDAFAAPEATESGSEKLKDNDEASEGEDGNEDSPEDSSEKPQKKRGLLKRLATKKNAKRGIIGGVLGAGLIGGSFGLMTIASGPFQLIQWAEILKGIHYGHVQEFQQERSRNRLIYALIGQNEKNRLGKIGNFLANRYEKKLNEEAGLKSVYSSVTRRLIGYEVIDPYKAADFQKDMPDLKTEPNEHMLDSSGTPFNEGGNRVISLRDDNFRTRRFVTKLAMKDIGTNRLSSYIGSRLLIKRGGVPFHPWKNIVRKATDNLADYATRVLKDEQKVVSGETDIAGVDTPDKKSTREKLFEWKGKLDSFLKAVKGPMAVIGIICGLKQFSSAIDQMNLNNMQIAERMGMTAVNGGSQVEAMNDYNVEQIGVYSQQLYDPATKTSVMDDPGVEHEEGDPQTGFDYISGMRPTASNDKPWFFQVADKIPTNLTDAIPGIGFAPPSLKSKLPNADICSIMSDATNFVTSLPVIKQAFDFLQGLINKIVEGVTWLATGQAKSLDDLLQAGIKYFADDAIDIAARGAKKGGIDNVGMRWGINDQMLAMGGRALTQSEENKLQTQARADQKEEFASASWYDRYLNVEQPGSAFGTLVMAMPTSRAQFFATMQRLPVRMADMLSESFGLGKAFAAPQTDYDYGFPMIAYSLDELQDGKHDNPFANEDGIINSGKLHDDNDKYGTPCFYMTINDDETLNNQPSGDQTKRPSYCNDKSDTELSNYRFFLGDLILGYQDACAEGDEDSCKQVGMSKDATNATGASSPTQVDMSTIFQASDTMSCAAGTDGGVQDGYYQGNLVKIKICVVQGIKVNARIASNVDALLTAAKGVGVNFSGSGFATMAEQQAKYDHNCSGGTCNPPTAKPGFSNHQMGLAIDFSQDGSLLSSGMSGFGWLQNNAAVYGLKNLPSENWHWSVDGN